MDIELKTTRLSPEMRPSQLPASDAGAQTVRRVLASWTVERMLAQKVPAPLMVLDSELTIEAALTRLAETRVLSAPVIDSSQNDCVGFFSLSDVLAWLLAGLFPQLLGAELTTPQAMAAHLAANQQAFRTDLAKWAADGFLAEHIIRPGSDGAMTWRVFGDTTLLDIVSRGLQLKQRAAPGDFEPAHRLGVFEEGPDGKVHVAGIISQSDVLRAMLAEQEALGEAVQRSVDALFGSKPVLCVPAEMPTIAAFALMHNTDVSGIGILDEAGRLVGNISVSDLRAIRTADCFSRLSLPVHHFAGAAGLEPAPLTPGGAAPQVVTVGLADSLATVMGKLVEHSLHRLYVADGAGKPVGVVTITDVLRLFAVGPDSEMLTW